MTPLLSNSLAPSLPHALESSLQGGLADHPPNLATNSATYWGAGMIILLWHSSENSRQLSAGPRDLVTSLVLKKVDLLLFVSRRL